jgi:AcrR family transcriptional regulator
MGRDVKSKRSYRSPRRQAQAEATKRDILVAAERLFERQGYPATTVAQVAQDAGVALKTVYLAFETKSGLLRALWNLLLRGDDESRPVAQQEWYRRVLDEPNPERRLRFNARNSTEGKQRISGILEVIRSAAPTDPEIAALWERIQREYRDNQHAIVERLHGHGHLRPELDVDRAADILWAINHPNIWQLLVVDRGWTPADYERWTGDVACAQLLPPRRRRTKVTPGGATGNVDGSEG